MSWWDGLRHRFRSRDLIKKALTHASVRQAPGKRRDNERLEFLGDRVLGLAIAELLWEVYPAADEGELARLYNRLVRGRTVIALASGVALVCAFDLASRGVVRGFVEVVDTMAGRAALQVSAGEGALFPENLVETVQSVSGVELAVPVVSATAFTADDTG